MGVGEADDCNSISYKKMPVLSLRALSFRLASYSIVLNIKFF